MAAYPDGLPTRVDGSLGRTKTNARAVEDLSYEVPAEEFNILADSVEGIAATLGLPNAVGMPAALATAISSGKVFALQQISTNGVQIAESTTLVEILAIDLYVVTSAQTAPSWRLIFGAYGLHLVPSDYGGAGVVTINGVADIVTFAEAGIYLLVGDGANAWTLTPATDYSAIDGAIASVQDAADAAQTRADDAYDLAQDAFNGLGGKLDNTGHTAKSVLVTDGSGNVVDSTPSTTDRLFTYISGVIAWTQLTIGMIADRLLTWAKLPAVAAHSLVARSANSSGDAGDLSIGTDEGVFNVAGVLTSQKVKLANLDAALQYGYDASQIQTVSSTSDTIAAGTRLVLVDTTAAGGNVSLTLPALSKGRGVTIVKLGTDLYTITLVRAGSESINGVAANFLLRGSTSTAGYVAWDVYDTDSTGSGARTSTPRAAMRKPVVGTLAATGSISVPANFVPNSFQAWGMPGAGGGGGGGGGAAGQSSASGTGGGGGGGGRGGGGVSLYLVPNINVAAGDTLTGTIGAGGAAGAAGSAGSTGSQGPSGGITSLYNGATELATWGRPEGGFVGGGGGDTLGGAGGGGGVAGVAGASGGTGGASTTTGGSAYQSTASSGSNAGVGGVGGAGGGASTAGSNGVAADPNGLRRGAAAGDVTRSPGLGAPGIGGAAGGTAGGGGGGGGGGCGGHGIETASFGLSLLSSSGANSGAGGTRTASSGDGGAGNSGGTGTAGNVGSNGQNGTIGRGGGGGQGGGGGGAGTTGGAGAAGGSGGSGSNGLIAYQYEVWG